MTPRLLVMAKAPVAGRVKTRLCPPCTPVDAARIAEACLIDTLRAACDTQTFGQIHVAIDGDAEKLLDAYPRVTAFPQTGQTFVDRLDHAWRLVEGPCVQIGMDTPQVTPGLLDNVAQMLMMPNTEAVLGLAQDGGWWCLGVRNPVSHMFDGIEMSTESTGMKQLARLEELGMHIELLPILQDLDTAADAVSIARLAPWTQTARVAATIPALSTELRRSGR